MDLSIKNYSVKTPAFRAAFDKTAEAALNSGIEAAVAKEKNPQEAKLLKNKLTAKLLEMKADLLDLGDGTVYLGDDIGKRTKSLKMSFIAPRNFVDFPFPKEIQALTITKDAKIHGMGGIIRNCHTIMQFPSSGLNWLEDCIKQIKLKI